MSTSEFLINNASYTQLIQHSHTISINVGSVSMGFVRVKDRFGYTQVNFFALKTLKKWRFLSQSGVKHGQATSPLR